MSLSHFNTKSKFVQRYPLEKDLKLNQQFIIIFKGSCYIYIVSCKINGKFPFFGAGDRKEKF